MMDELTKFSDDVLDFCFEVLDTMIDAVMDLSAWIGDRLFPNA